MENNGMIEITMLQFISLETTDKLSIPIINYVCGRQRKRKFQMMRHINIISGE
ncbi:hypothetical protein [Candidatus Scalindua japonica]|uniref:hypothetical protein n=1 Tax=Candidatus Scalindua japonica TaxID=1284222 RepID=UPI0013A53D69|nr:hypothetical protein [Candidatus Scalindua japonica]